MRQLFHMWIGGLTAGIFWGFLESTWLYLKPIIPFGFVKVQTWLPPENMFYSFLLSVVTYSILASVLALCLFSLIKIINLAFSRRKISEILLQTSTFYLSLLLFLVLFLGTFVRSGFGLPFTPSRLGIIGIGSIIFLGISWFYYNSTKKGRQFKFYATYFISLLIMTTVAALSHSRIDSEVHLETVKTYSPKINIIFITIDTLRADRLHCYGNERIATPVIDKLAREGFLFENAIAQIPATTPSHCSIFSSLYPYEHRAENAVPMAPNTRTLPIILRKLGYTTVAFTSAYTTKSIKTGLGPGFTQYFDSLSSWFDYGHLDELEQLAFYRMFEQFEGNQIRADVVNRRVLSWLDSFDASMQPFFMWLHYFDPHKPYDQSPEPYRSLYTRDVNMSDRREMTLAQYDGEIAYNDNQLGVVLNKFKELGLLQNTLIILTSDHGELFGEHGSWEHGPKLYEGVIKVPLIFWWPGKVAPGTAFAVVETIDIAPTVLELLGLSDEEQFKGQSLASLIMGGRAQDLDTYAFSESRRFLIPRLTSVRSDKWKYILNTDDGDIELYDLKKDPNELENVAEAQIKVGQELHKRLTDTIASFENKDDLDDLDRTTMERLKALGYIQ